MLVKKISILCEGIGEKYDMSDVEDVPKSSHKKGRVPVSPRERPIFFGPFSLTGPTPSRLNENTVFFFNKYCEDLIYFTGLKT